MSSFQQALQDFERNSTSIARSNLDAQESARQGRDAIKSSIIGANESMAGSNYQAAITNAVGDGARHLGMDLSAKGALIGGSQFARWGISKYRGYRIGQLNSQWKEVNAQRQADEDNAGGDPEGDIQMRELRPTRRDAPDDDEGGEGDGGEISGTSFMDAPTRPAATSSAADAEPELEGEAPAPYPPPIQQPEQQPELEGEEEEPFPPAPEVPMQSRIPEGAGTDVGGGSGPRAGMSFEEAQQFTQESPLDGALRLDAPGGDDGTRVLRQGPSSRTDAERIAEGDEPEGQIGQEAAQSAEQAAGEATAEASGQAAEMAGREAEDLAPEITEKIAATVAGGVGSKVAEFLGGAIPIIGPILDAVSMGQMIYSGVKEAKADMSDPFKGVKQQINSANDEIGALQSQVGGDQFQEKIGAGQPAFGSLSAPALDTSKMASSALHF